MRQLASIQRVVDLQPIPGADKIEVATVLGWQCVVTKADGFKVGDLGVYFEIDSILPPRPEFFFMEPRHYRVRTIKLRKQVSQGLLMPLSILPSGINPKEGTDVTEALGVTKHLTAAEREADRFEERLERKYGKVLGFFMKNLTFRRFWRWLFGRSHSVTWPEWITVTDETRIQNVPSYLSLYKDKEFYVTEKMDGQSATFFTKTVRTWWGGKKKIFGVCSRTVWKHNQDCLWWKVAKQYGIEEILRSYPEDLILQGEQCAPSVQGNKYAFSEPKLFIFNIIGPEGQYCLQDMEDFCVDNGLETVPVLDRKFKLPETVKEMVEISKGKSVINPKIHREGLVVRCVEDGKKISFKVINPDFLLKYEEEDEKIQEEYQKMLAAKELK